MLKIYETPPSGFVSEVEVSACYLETEGKILLLQLGPSKKEVGRWGVPAGKLALREPKEVAAKRELYEETGIDLQAEAFVFLGTIYIEKPELKYTYHLFKVEVPQCLPVLLSEENQASLWAHWEDLKCLPLMTGAHPALEWYQRLKAQLPC